MVHMPQDRMAFDRMQSVRRTDIDGHLFVSPVVLSASDVCGYLGREIPGFDSLGLDPDRVYQMYRDSASLDTAASSMNGKPILMMHRAISADDHPHSITVGAVGNDTRFEPPNLVGSLSVWSADAIAAIESGEMRCVSAGYRYQPVMEPGIVAGVSYDGKMIVEAFNHLALVAEPRVKAAVIGDGALVNQACTSLGPAAGTSTMETINMLKSRKALVASGALMAFLSPRMAKDAALPDLNAILKDTTAANWAAQKPALKMALDAAVAGKLAKDASLDEVVSMLDKLDDVTDEAAMDEDTDETEEEKAARLAKEKTAEDEDAPEMKPDMKGAMDAAINAAVTKAVAATETAVIGRMNNLREAERVVRPYVGEIAVAMDSADAVYRFALGKMGVDHKDLHPTALKPVLLAQPVPGAVKPKNTTVAMDAASAKAMAERIPGVDRIRHV